MVDLSFLKKCEEDLQQGSQTQSDSRAALKKLKKNIEAKINVYEK